MSPSPPVYLDYMATTPVDPQVIDKMAHCLSQPGLSANPSSPHIYGQRAQLAIEQAGQHLATLINVDPRTIIWTSGATESNNLAITGATHFYRHQGKHIITLNTEHQSVLACCANLEQKGFDVTYLSPASNGQLPLADLKRAIRPDTILVSIMHANNEIGVLQDIDAIGTLIRKHGILFHVDAAQSLGKIPINLKHWPIDLMSFSAHKIYGPKGIGALYVRHEPRIHLTPLFYGGSQQQGLRVGTLPTHQIVGMGEACRLAHTRFYDDQTHIKQLRDQLLQALNTIGGITFYGDLTQRLPGNLNFSVNGVHGESLMLALQQEDLLLSHASACHLDSDGASHVLQALNIAPEIARYSLRLSLGRTTTRKEITITTDALTQVISRLRNLAP